MTATKRPNSHHPKSEGTAIELRKRIAELGTNPRRVSAEISFAYDTVRKVCKGDEFPGPNLLRSLCSYLNLDMAKMQKLIDMDKAAEKGWVAPTGNDDELLTELKKYWVHLNKKDKTEILDLVRVKASRPAAR